MHTESDSHDRIHYWLADESAAGRVAGYFRESDPTRLFSGRLFERIGLDVLTDRDPASYRDPANPVNRISSDDLVAVQMLSVQIPPEVSFDLLYGALGNELAGLLAQVPTDVALSDPQARQLIGHLSAADQAWSLLMDQPGMGPTRVGKALAHKRPHLLPVYDDVVRCAVGHPQSWWLTLHSYLTDDRHDSSGAINRLREDGRVPGYVSDLRVIDVAIWRGHAAIHAQNEKNHRKCEPPQIVSDN